MSASRDKTQKIAFVYQNLYKIYRDQGPGGSQSQDQVARRDGVSSGAVIKAGVAPGLKIRAFEPSHLKAPLDLQQLKQQVAQAQSTPSSPPPFKPIKEFIQQAQENNPVKAPIESLKDSLKRLNDLHSRLKFMLEEIEELKKNDE